MGNALDLTNKAATQSSISARSERTDELKAAVQAETYGACIERAVLWTDYYQSSAPQGKSVARQMAEATRYVLNHKTVEIYPNELIVGNFSAQRVAGICYPELGRVGVMAEVFELPTRRVNPLAISPADQEKLYSLIPYWQDRSVLPLAFETPQEQARFAGVQSTALEYQLYEAGGIAHLAPGYEKVIELGAQGIIDEAQALAKQTDDPAKLEFYEAVQVSMRGLAEFGDRYAAEATRLAELEDAPQRKRELQRIAEICARVPRQGATSFYEAVQSMALTHIAIFQETSGETTCPGRVDQFLNHFYEHDLAAGVVTRAEAKDILGAFCVKLCETIPMYSEALTSMLGGMTSWEVVTIGGQDAQGNDATNELSYILLELADELRMRQPNFHVRLHKNTPQAFYDEVIRVNFGPGSAPAMYNDDTIIESMTNVGYSLEDARDYVAIGCVEPTSPGRTLGSTDAGMYNMALALEMALNEGRQLGSDVQIGAATPPVANMASMADVLDAYKTQVTHQLAKLHADLQRCEYFHATYHPTPLTSATVEGCMEQGVCSTQGGAKYNFSGIQGTGMAVVADSLGAIEKAVFEDGWLTLPELVQHLENDLADETVRARLQGIDKFGNDIPSADAWMKWVGDHYSDSIHALGKNTRGGQYLAGVYSNTSHTHFGSLTSATPNGRRKGETFASGFAPENGADKRGSTALINSMNRIDFKKFANGINFNIKLDASSYECDDGKQALGSMYKVYFKRHGMQVQANMLDPKILIEARDNPELHPNLLIRVSGYSAYFNDLSPEMQDEVISRSSNKS